MATVEKRVRNGKTSYSVRYRDPAGHSRRKVFTRKVDGDRWMAENEAARLRGAWIDPAAGREMHFLDAVQVEALADAIDPRYPTLVRFAACTGLRPCELVALRVGRLDSAELGAYLAGRPHTPDDLEFTAPLGRPLRESKFVPGYFKPAARAAGFPDTLRFHDLRHTAASLLIREGASIKAVQKQLGHATASITLDTYGHLFPDELDALAAAWRTPALTP